ncbi:MAG: methylmalonyl-CoA mutase small subunit [Bacteroidales bacterium]|nr:methylmalonyl-CoA mutase small subunit [Bacteroidales bacterium]MBP3344325.1 methylmalonyl-CoA mutase small subunit [Bacteroidales bacterium]MBQ6871195.1 methylmalonyl-CoA mutase small subunit [Bacteroidales bacterium]MBQ7999542.1 methylmalonyl-CoA mutase small subunit [Bacteroidales bacterium]MBR4094095.1 methylmalonyl-CoA mutase small subunit [Bacteroidales bacterium]
MAEKLFAEFPPVSTEQWEQVIIKDLKGADYEKKLVWKTQEGFSVRPYYRAENLTNLKHLGTEAGCFPFVRGTKDNNNWLVRQDYCACTGNYAEANAQALDGLKKGVESVGFCIDGKKAISEAEMQTLLNGIDLAKVEVNFTGCCCATAEIVNSFLSVAKAQGVGAEDLKASFDFDPLRVLNQTGAFCSEKSLSQLKDVIEAAKDFPRVRVIGVEAYSFNDAGASIVQELAFGLAMGSEYLNTLMEAGLSADDAARRIKFTFSVGSTYFMEIAKFRAARMLWANIVKAYGSERECCQKMKIHAVTSSWNQTVYDAYVNMLRGTTEAMSAAIAGVDSLEVLPFDYAFRAPGEFSNRIARNTQILLKEECHFDKVVDPSAGSYFIENLTESIADTAWKLFNEVEKMGGYIEAFKAGFVQNAIKETADKRDKNIATRRETILGTNQYPNFTEKIDADVTAEVVTRKPAPEVSGAMVGAPLEKYRGAQAFEAMRYTTDKSGKQPVAFMVTYGNLAMCRARAQFACNFFAVAGFKVVDNNRFATVEEGVKAALEAKADIIVACSSDEEYAEGAPQIAALAGDKAIVVVAGEPACKEELVAKGITNFISVKSNVLETLKDYQTKLGIK